MATLDFLVAGTSQFLALTTLPIQRYRKYKMSPQLHLEDTKICYLQYRLRAVINSLDLLRECLSRLALSVTHVLICVSYAFALRADARSLCAV